MSAARTLEVPTSTPMKFIINLLTGKERKNTYQMLETSELAITPTSAIQAREEKPYTEYFPDLQLDQDIQIVRYNLTEEAAESSNDLFRKLSNLVYTFVERVSTPIASKTPEEQEFNSMMGKQESVGSKESLVETLIDLDDHLKGPVLHPKYPENLPKTSFSTNESQWSYPTPFERPRNKLIRYSESNEEELEQKVEYDLDEQDLCWLQLVNAKRKAADLPSVHPDYLEKVMDTLEKEWFHLAKDIAHRSNEPLSHEECICSICQDGEVDNSNAIVFCDGCNIAVHQECYGVPYIPEGQWLCRKCMIAPEKPVNCIFCPNADGAFKQTTTNRWAHLLCTLWIPEVYVSNPVYMEPIEGVDKIPKSRWKLVCSLCKLKVGACIQCSKPTCFAAYHVTCARKAGLFMKSKTVSNGDEHHVVYKSFCQKHRPSSMHNEKIMSDTSYECMTDASDSEMPQNTIEVSIAKKKKKTAIISLSGPVIPQKALLKAAERLDKSKFCIRKRYKFMLDVCKYWSLKRRYRRGAPLLKRLHLEPWTEYSSSIRQNEAIQIQRFKILEHLREDLETVRTLVDMCKKREREKLKHVKNLIKSYKIILSPTVYLIEKVLKELMIMDKHKIYWQPVSAIEVPDYLNIIKRPISFDVMQSKIEKFQYHSINDFKQDVDLLVSNALLYNKKETIYAKIAIKIQQRAHLLLDQIQSNLNGLPVDQASKCLDIRIPGVYASVDAAQENTQSEINHITVSTSPNKASEALPGTPKKTKLPKFDSMFEEIMSTFIEKSKQRDKSAVYWCKIEGFPWFPAEEIINIKRSEYNPPKDVLAMNPKNGSSLFRFFDRDLLNKRTWAWINDDRKVKFDFSSNDANQLNSVVKKVKSPNIKKQVICGYIAGCLSSGINPFPILELAGFDTSNSKNLFTK